MIVTGHPKVRSAMDKSYFRGQGFPFQLQCAKVASPKTAAVSKNFGHGLVIVSPINVGLTETGWLNPFQPKQKKNANLSRRGAAGLLPRLGSLDLHVGIHGGFSFASFPKNPGREGARFGLVSK